MSVRANNPTLMPRSVPRSTIAALCTGTLLIAIFAAMVVWLQSDLRSEIHLKILERDAAVLYPMALQQVSENGGITASSPFAALRALLRSSRQKGMLGVAVFDRDGNAVEAVPSTQLFVELQAEDLLRLQGGRPITRYHPLFALDQYFACLLYTSGPPLSTRLKNGLKMSPPFPHSSRCRSRSRIPGRTVQGAISFSGCGWPETRVPPGSGSPRPSRARWRSTPRKFRLQAFRRSRCRTPVSYTHLDVYKRQAYRSVE